MRTEAERVLIKFDNRIKALEDQIMFQDKCIHKLMGRNEQPVIKDPNSERIDKILSYITLDDDIVFIHNGIDYVMKSCTDIEVLYCAIMTGKAYQTYGDSVDATRDNFDIREGTIGEAKLGDLFISFTGEIEAHSIEVAGFKVKDFLSPT